MKLSALPGRPEMGRFLLPVLMFLSLTTLAQQESVTGADLASGEEASASAETEDQDAASRNEAPEPENLRRTDLAEAFKQFKPSEEISADNAVPFPTDI